MKNLFKILMSVNLLLLISCQEEEVKNDNPPKEIAEQVETLSCMQIVNNDNVTCLEITVNTSATDDFISKCYNWEYGKTCKTMMDSWSSELVHLGSCEFRDDNDAEAQMFHAYNSSDLIFDTANTYVDSFATVCNQLPGSFYNYLDLSALPLDNLVDEAGLDGGDIAPIISDDLEGETPVEEEVIVSEEAEEPSAVEEEISTVTVSCYSSGITFDYDYNSVYYTRCQEYEVLEDSVDSSSEICGIIGGVFLEAKCEDRSLHYSNYLLGICDNSYSKSYYYSSSSYNSYDNRNTVRRNRCYGTWSNY